MQKIICTKCAVPVRLFTCVASLDIEMSLARERGCWAAIRTTLSSSGIETDIENTVATCPNCGGKDKLKDLSQVVSVCDECGDVIDVEFNPHCVYSGCDICEKHYKQYISRNCRMCSETARCPLFKHWNSKLEKSKKHVPDIQLDF